MPRTPVEKVEIIIRKCGQWAAIAIMFLIPELKKIRADGRLEAPQRPIKTAKILIRRYGPWVATASIIFVFALEHSDPKSIPLQVVLLSTSVVLVFSQLEQSNEELSSAIEKNLRESAKITNAVMPELYSLEECLKDLTIRIRPLTRRDEVTVRHVGLDMRDAWSDVERMLRAPQLQMNVNYQLVMITSEYAKLGEVDQEIIDWCEYVGKTALKNITTDVTIIGNEYREVNRRLKFEAKEYVYSPFVHGFEVQGPVNICYMALCRWKPKGNKFKFDWGDRTYFRIIKENADPIQCELYRVFASTFERHWGTNPVLSFAFDSDVRPPNG